MRSAVILALTIVVLGCAVEATEAPPASPAATRNGLTGSVLETMDAASYTYVRMETAEGEVWAAVPQTRLEVGAQVTIADPQAMSNFESKTLGRKFDTIYFGTLDNPSGSAPMMQSGESPHGVMGGMASQSASSATPIEVAKAEGPAGRTIAELYAERGELSGEVVALRGKVVKYNADIMGRNWFHLQDGTGDAAASTNDITVTSFGRTEVGDVVLVEGTVAVDKDFGAGYRYAVIVEDASLK